VFAFRKSFRAAQFFDLVKRIQNNYAYYQNLFNVQERNYRNDYAFAMADIILNGFTVNHASIPGSLLAIDQPIESITPRDNSLIVRDENYAYVVPKTNLHIMSKAYLQSKNFSCLVEWALNESA
jgi:argonaute-like protein implicated in RNA metabolism and viral defense